MTPLDAAVAWVCAGGGQGAERDSLLDATERRGGYLCPSGRVHTRVDHALKLWKAAARRALRGADRRGPKLAPREAVTVWATAHTAGRLRKGETVTITGATLVEVCDG